MLSAFALVAIGLSLFLQAREMRFSRQDAERSHHFQLMQLLIENPALSRGLGIPRTGLNPQVHVYLNLLTYWEMLFITRAGGILRHAGREKFLGGHPRAPAPGGEKPTGRAIRLDNRPRVAAERLSGDAGARLLTAPDRGGRSRRGGGRRGGDRLAHLGEKEARHRLINMAGSVP
ncbi:DUF6082 family protein [Nonomuraea angiospora]|nr:DUF6082 family protein [Nonomuraea angiospora]MDX3108915.1 DUF6082 family protein [Nonomuraea angiospora]